MERHCEHLRANIRAYIFRDGESTDEFPSDLTRKQMSSRCRRRERRSAQRKQNNGHPRRERQRERKRERRGGLEERQRTEVEESCSSSNSFLPLHPDVFVLRGKLRGPARSRHFSFSWNIMHEAHGGLPGFKLPESLSAIACSVPL